ncbi:hypothetical protein PPYR_08766 [Photinus pyralis]|uniref:PDZ domain-containing protein n=2 Tax=Photinus pyralis TaxID=7054 RepID=A0A5N4AKG6_PHOPY|nr:uncharacterized protein LOC116170558 isoform X3 [Photinus pyralis]KAB0797773.1 hypothetical protein PPYR_08766 [Photinus pyralis]
MPVSSLQRPSFWNYKPSSKKKVAFGSPSDGVLQRGDIISKVGNYDARDIRHEDAQNLFRNAGDNIRIVVQRDHQARPNTSTGSSRSSSRNYGSPLSVSPHLSPRGGGAYHAGSALMPTYGAPFEEMREGYFDEIPDIRGQRRRNDNIDVHVVNQPYRTTPLVLPGAKVKPDQTITECYLRHHPNPNVRARPHHLDADYYYKQKVADSVLQRISTDDPSKQVVHKQFNSPIGLYSDPNIADTLQRQTGANVSRRNVKYDPSKSETYKALQEQSYSDRVHEVPVPPQTRIYTPIPGKKHHNATHHQPYQNNTNSLASPDDDDIQQSHSFKRLMWSVLPETDY